MIDAITRPLGAMLLRLPTWAAVAAISATSVGLTVGVVLIIHWFGPGYGDGLRRALTMGSVLPFVVSTPCAWIVIGLLRALEREHRIALELARSDTLTGLANRSTLLEVACRDIELARRSGRPLAVALLDLDDFKAVNDRHGHAIGDALLRRIADACTATVRGTDVVARWGGEEIVILLPDTGKSSATASMERLRGAVSASRVDTPDGGVLGCTASIGIACLAREPGEVAALAVFQKLVGAADKAMYTAKRSGKDRVVVFEEDTAATVSLPANPSASPV